jgi:hypothetical protein
MTTAAKSHAVPVRATTILLPEVPSNSGSVERVWASVATWPTP